MEIHQSHDRKKAHKYSHFVIFARLGGDKKQPKLSGNNNLGWTANVHLPPE
jgi:hypothetical protein